ncbi:MAG: YfiR family protein [bacterium]
MKQSYHKKTLAKRLIRWACLLLLFGQVGRAQEMPVPLDLQLQLFTKILTFDKNLEQRGGDTLRIAVIYQNLYLYSANTREVFFSAADEMKLQWISGFPVRILACDLRAAAELREFILDHNIDIIYIAPLRAVPVDALTDISRDLGVLSFTGVTDYMKHGVSVGLDIKDDRPKILVNQNNARQEGTDFSSRLLHLAKIIN